MNRCSVTVSYGLTGEGKVSKEKSRQATEGRRAAALAKADLDPAFARLGVSYCRL